MAHRKTKSELQQAIEICKQLSLYVKADAYESIMSDYKYFYGINERNINSFINELIARLIEYAAQKQDTISVSETELDSNEKNGYRSGEVIRFRLSANLRKALYESEMKCKSVRIETGETESIANIVGSIEYDDSEYASNLKKYFDLLLYKYGSLPTHKREAIYFQKRYAIISESIAKHRKLKIESNDNICEVRPYRLLADASVKYLYLTGYVGNVIRSFRFSRLTIHDHDYNDNSGELRSKEIEKIKKRIKESGIAYLTEEAENIEVLMTDYGFDLYSKFILHQRPNLIDNGSQQPQIEELTQDETNQYKSLTGFEYKKRVRCYCTKRQARYYFSRFGCDAVIVDPVDLAEECRAFAVNASNAYNEIIDSKGTDH